MKSDLKKKTQDAIDMTREIVDGCHLVMLVDRETGLVLCSSTEGAVSYDQLESLAESARKQIHSAAVTSLPGVEGDAKHVIANQFEASGIVAIVQDLSARDEILVCRCDRTPIRADLLEAANEVFAMSSSTEAA